MLTPKYGLHKFTYNYTPQLLFKGDWWPAELCCFLATCLMTYICTYICTA